MACERSESLEGLCRRNAMPRAEAITRLHDSVMNLLKDRIVDDVDVTSDSPTLGEGASARVCLGSINASRVAIKMLIWSDHFDDRKGHLENMYREMLVAAKLPRCESGVVRRCA